MRTSQGGSENRPQWVKQLRRIEFMDATVLSKSSWTSSQLLRHTWIPRDHERSLSGAPENLRDDTSRRSSDAVADNVSGCESPVYVQANWTVSDDFTEVQLRSFLVRLSTRATARFFLGVAVRDTSQQSNSFGRSNRSLNSGCLNLVNTCDRCGKCCCATEGFLVGPPLKPITYS